MDEEKKIYKKIKSAEKWYNLFGKGTIKAIIATGLFCAFILYANKKTITDYFTLPFDQCYKEAIWLFVLLVLICLTCIVLLIIFPIKVSQYKRLKDTPEMKEYEEQRSREINERAEKRKEQEKLRLARLYNELKPTIDRYRTNYLLVYAGAVYNGHYDREGTRYVIVDGRPYATANPWAKIALPSGYHTVFIRYIESVSGRIYQTDTPSTSVCADESSKVLSSTKDGTYIRDADLYDISDLEIAVAKANDAGAPPLK